MLTSEQLFRHLSRLTEQNSTAAEKEDTTRHGIEKRRPTDNHYQLTKS